MYFNINYICICEVYKKNSGFSFHVLIKNVFDGKKKMIHYDRFNCVLFHVRAMITNIVYGKWGMV